MVTLIGSTKFTSVLLIVSFVNGRGKNHGTLTEPGDTVSASDGGGVVVVVVVPSVQLAWQVRHEPP